MSTATKEWTTPADIREQVLKQWNRGTLLSTMVDKRELFPLRITLRKPGSREITDRFADVRDWISGLRASAGHYRIVWRTINHRVHGSNTVPSEIWIDTMDDALSLIGKRRAGDEFASMVERCRKEMPDLLPWLARRPLRALEHSESWPAMLRLADWLRHHPRPGVYLRQIELPGVHSKFIEQHCGMLSELFDLALPPGSIDEKATGTTNFCQRYGFRDKPLRVRFRILDPALCILPEGNGHEITLTRDDFARLPIPVDTVFITENEINFLAFPPTPGAMVIFGAGYGFGNLATADWLQDKTLYYWGDIDTHGFAILNQFRHYFPHASSFLMERETLLAHRRYWEREPRPETAPLPRLSEDEHSLYDDLRHNRLGDRIRLEQEKIGYSKLLEALENIDSPSA